MGAREDAERWMAESPVVRGLALTAEQRRRRDEVDERCRLISRGVLAPASGTFGKPKAEKREAA